MDSIKQLLKVIFRVCSIFRGLRHRAAVLSSNLLLLLFKAIVCAHDFTTLPTSSQQPIFSPAGTLLWSACIEAVPLVKTIEVSDFVNLEARGWSSCNASIHLRVSTKEPFIPKIAKWALVVAVAAVLNRRQETLEQPRWVEAKEESLCHRDTIQLLWGPCLNRNQAPNTFNTTAPVFRWQRNTASMSWPVAHWDPPLRPLWENPPLICPLPPPWTKRNGHPDPLCPACA